MLEDNIGVGMKAEYLWLVFQRELVNVFFDIQNIQILRGFVNVAFTEQILLSIQNMRIEVSTEQGCY